MNTDDNDTQNLPTLEQVLLAFQKSMARVSQATNNASKYDPNFLTGKRSLFAVEALDIEMSAGLILGSVTTDPGDDKIHVDFEASKEARSSIKFRIEAKPLEQISGNRLMLSRLDPLKEKSNVNQFLVWFWNGKEMVAKKEVYLFFTPSGAPGRGKRVETKTDMSGRLTFSVDPQSGKFLSPVSFKPKAFSLDPAFDWFVQAKLKDDPERVSIILPIRKS